MKRFLSLILAGCLALSLTGCISWEDRERKDMLDEYNGYKTVDYEMEDGTTLDQQVIYETGDVKMTVLGIKSAEYSESELWMRVENNSDQEVHVEVSGIAVNGWQVDTYAYFDVKSNSMQRKCADWGYYDQQISPYGDTVGSVTIYGEVKNADYEKIADIRTELKTSAYDQVKDELLHSSYDTSGQVLYAKNDIQIIYQGFTDDFTALRFYVQNDRKESVTLSSDNLMPAVENLPNFHEEEQEEYLEENCYLCSSVLNAMVLGGSKRLVLAYPEYYLPESFLVWDSSGYQEGCWIEDEEDSEEYDESEEIPDENRIRVDQTPYRIGSISIESGKTYRTIDKLSDVELTYHLEQPNTPPEGTGESTKEDDAIAAVGEPEEAPPATGTEDAAMEAPPTDEADSAAQEGTAQTESSSESPAAAEAPPVDEAEGTAQTETVPETETPPVQDVVGEDVRRA